MVGRRRRCGGRREGVHLLVVESCWRVKVPWRRAPASVFRGPYVDGARNWLPSRMRPSADTTMLGAPLRQPVRPSSRLGGRIETTP